MSLADFWLNVRRGADWIAPQVVADSRKLDAKGIEGALRRADLWLSSKYVEGFSDNDFGFLPKIARTRLSKMVGQFRAVAEAIPKNGPVPQDVLKQALPLFKGIVDSLEFDRFADPEAFRIGKQIELRVQDRPASELAYLLAETGLDHTGDAAIWIWAILKDEFADTEERFFESSRVIRTAIETVAREIAPERWPYVRCRTETGQAQGFEAQLQ